MKIHVVKKLDRTGQLFTNKWMPILEIGIGEDRHFYFRYAGSDRNARRVTRWYDPRWSPEKSDPHHIARAALEELVVDLACQLLRSDLGPNPRSAPWESIEALP